MTIKEIQKNILKLSPTERVRIIDNIIASLDKPDPNIEQAWANESDKRLKAYRKGQIKGIDIEKVKKRIFH